MTIYEIEKNIFSSLQSSFHRLLNTLKTKELNKQHELMLLEINNHIDILNSKLLEFNENKCINNQQIRTKEVENDNKVIKDLIPIALMYRMMLNP